MSKPKYLRQKGEFFYPISHTKAIYDNNGVVLEDRLTASTTNHEIHVPCDGDHDELKLQAAIDSAPENSVVYPVGTCVITNDNIQMGVGGMADTYGAILNIKEKCTLDGRYCHSMTFVNSNPQTNQVIFLMQANTKIKNLDFAEDLDTTATPPQPTLIYSKGTCEISNCNFSEISDTGVSNIPMIYVTGKNNIFGNNIFSNIYFTVGSHTSPPIEIEADVIGNTFDGGYRANNDGNSSTMIRFKGLVHNNKFSKFELSGGAIQFYPSTKEGVIGNKFSNLKDVQFDFWCCNINENIFATCNIRMEYGVLINLNGSLSNPILFSNNTLSALGATVDNVSLINVVNEHCKVSNNYIAISQAVGITTGIDAVGKSHIQNNTIKLTQFAVNSTTLDVCKGSSGAIFANNITNATSLGIFDETCVVERNITAEVSV